MRARRGSIWAIVPVKSLGNAKQRLAGVLSVEARRRLMLVMLREVLTTLSGIDAIAAVMVVTPDPQAAELALAMYNADAKKKAKK